MSREAKKAISKGSKSFFLASLFFPKTVKLDCWILYRWCRYCDDLIDEGGGPAEYEFLRQNTLLGLQSLPAPEEFRDLGEVCRRYHIPEALPMQLLKGFQKDVQGIQIQSPADLEAYAYQVAGVVGLMMSYIMGAAMPVAESSAHSLGNAMQLTNIARDIRDDFRIGRIYLPTDWLKEAKIEKSHLLHDSQREKTFAIVKKLLQRADELYQEGYAGLCFLPIRAAIAVSIAGSIYSAIGRKILKIGPSALDQRVIISFPEKLVLVFEGFRRAITMRSWRRPQRRQHANAQ